MININQITTQLRMLPDQALQRVAMMYKQDPYILPLVVSEGMARKKLRAASQAQMAQPQPKVADQAVASLGYTPEESGIAQLQAQNMQGLADGGIAGYAEGGVADSAEDSFSRGGMFDFTQRSEPVVRMAEGGVAQYAGKDESLVRLSDYDVLSDILNSQGLRSSTGETYAEMKARQRREKELADAAEAEGRPFARFLKAGEEAGGASRLSPAMAALRRTMYPTQEELGVTRAAPAAPSAATAPSSASAASALPQRTSFPSQALERAVVQRPEAPPAAGEKGEERIRMNAPQFKSDPSLYSLDPAVLRKRARELMPTNEYETAYNVLAQEELERMDAREAERARNKPTGKAREGLEALLKQEGEGAAKEKSDAGAFALISAGLAIASGESPNALMNIAKGLNVGAKEYQAAVKDLKKADRERKLMMADIEEARRLEAKGDYDKAEERKDKVEERRSSIKRNTMQGIMQLKLNQDQIAAGFAKAAQEGGIKRDLVGAEIGALAARTEATIAAQERIARIQYAARTEPAAQQAVARVTQAINSSKYLGELAKQASLGIPAAIERYRKEEERLYLMLAPELMIGVGGSETGKSTGARAAGDAVLNKGG
jgi:hypothetical protein